MEFPIPLVGGVWILSETTQSSLKQTQNHCLLHFFVRWRIVIHAGVDGYSRIPVYLHASSNNCAATVLNLFTEAVSTFGLPSRVRCDKGGENYDVGFYMLNHPRRGPGRGSVIVGDVYL